MRVNRHGNYSWIFSNSDLGAPQAGQTQSSGRFSNGVPGLTPATGSPSAGSYTYPQTLQIHLSTEASPLIDQLLLILIFFARWSGGANYTDQRLGLIYPFKNRRRNINIHWEEDGSDVTKYGKER